MNKVFILAFICLLIFISGCEQTKKPKTAADEAYEREYAKIASVTPAPASTEPRKYTEPVIGMEETAFDKLCGKPDHIEIYESKNGRTETLRYEYSKARSKTRCWGTFTFREGELDSMFR